MRVLLVLALLWTGCQKGTGTAPGSGSGSGGAEPEQPVQREPEPPVHTESGPEARRPVPESFDVAVKAVITREGQHALCNDLNGCNMVASLVALGRDAAPAVQRAFRQSAGDAYWRLMMLNTLGRLNHPDSGAFLAEVLTADAAKEAVRIQAALALGKLKSRAHHELLTGLSHSLSPVNDLPVLLAVAYALALLGDTAGVALIERHLVVPEGKVLRWDRFRPGITAVGKLRLAGLRARVEAFSRRADPFVRRECAQALGDLRMRESIPALIELLRDQVPGVREAAQRALESITGFKHKTGADQWDRWWKSESAGQSGQ